MKKLYIDHTNEGDGPIGIFIQDTEVIYTGTEINAAPSKMRNAPIIQEGSKNGIHFFFDDEDISLGIYTVPFMEAFARDDNGGIFAKEIDDNAPVYYINADLQVFQAASTFQVFITDLESWKVNLRPSQSVQTFSSRADAQLTYNIFDLADIIGEHTI